MAKVAATPPAVAPHAVVANVADVLNSVVVIVPWRQVHDAPMDLAAVRGGDRNSINDQFLAIVVAPQRGLHLALLVIQRQLDPEGVHGALSLKTLRIRGARPRS